MQSRADQYRRWAAICESTDYGKRSAVRKHNAGARRMRAMVEKAKGANTSAVFELLPLLDEPQPAKWLAFQLLELIDVPDAIVERCLEVIMTIAADRRDLDAMGAQMWLRDYETKRASNSVAIHPFKSNGTEEFERQAAIAARLAALQRIGCYDTRAQAGLPPLSGEAISRESIYERDSP